MESTNILQEDCAPSIPHKTVDSVHKVSHHNLCWVSLDEHRPVSSFTYLNYSLCQRILPACIGHFVFMSSSPDIHDHFDILDEVHDIATRWKPFGAALRLPMPVLDRIETDRRDARSCLSEVVTE